MTWAIIIGVILKIVEPLLAALVQHWLANHLKAAAAKLPPPESYPSAEEHHAALFNQAIADCGPLEHRHRALLERIKAVGVKDMTAEDEHAIRGLGAAVTHSS